MPEGGKTLQEVMAAASRKLHEDKQGRDKPKGRLVVQRL
jgi:hypothetical protein